MNPGYTSDINSYDAKEFHGLWIKPGSDQINARAEPFVRWLAFLKSNVSSSFKFSHESMYILLRHIIYLLPLAFIHYLQILQVLVLVIDSALEKGNFVFDVAKELVVLHRVQRVLIELLWTVSHRALKFSMVGLAQVLSFLQFSLDLVELFGKL